MFVMSSWDVLKPLEASWDLLVLGLLGPLGPSWNLLGPHPPGRVFGLGRTPELAIVPHQLNVYFLWMGALLLLAKCTVFCEV